MRDAWLLFFYIQQQVFQRLAILPRLTPQPALLRFEHALGHVAQGVRVVLTHKLTGIRVQ